MFVNRFIFRTFPAAKCKITPPLVSVNNLTGSSTSNSSNYRNLTSTCGFGLYDNSSKGIFSPRSAIKDNRLAFNISECSKRYRRHQHSKREIRGTDAQHFDLLKHKEKRYIGPWNSEQHKMEMERLGVKIGMDLGEENEHSKELRLQMEKVQQKAVLTEIETQLLNPHQPLFAVVQITGRQYKVSEGDILIIQGFWAPEVGDRLRFEKILLFGGSDFSLIGQPMVDWTKFRVEGTIIEKTFSDLQLHYVLRKRQNYRRLNFNKISYTMVRITKIEYEPPQLE